MTGNLSSGGLYTERHCVLDTQARRQAYRHIIKQAVWGGIGTATTVNLFHVK